ncbi:MULTISPECIES: hypothetical protein [Pseudomonas]|uniref:hypothetical protein n=1 Tax=Pseudomonas TaxID=286 RepID=UPI0005C61FB2|nr:MULTISPECIES: hypothetical protein [Pseudomonas]WOB60584.1 hypothetical protein NY023_09075 [Pseudomonas sp. NBB]
MDQLALIIAVIAIVATFASATSTSVRNEAHQQANNIQSILKELSEITHRQFENYLFLEQENTTIDHTKANIYEATFNMKLDLLESNLELLVRRCSSMFFYDAESPEFYDQYIGMISDLRNQISILAYTTKDSRRSILVIDGKLTVLYSALNRYIGNRFRPIFEKRDDAI